MHEEEERTRAREEQGKEWIFAMVWMFLLYWTIHGKESTFLQPCPVPSVPNSHHSSSNSETIQRWEDDKTMVRIPKISFETFYCWFGFFFFHSWPNKGFKGKFSEVLSGFFAPVLQTYIAECCERWSFSPQSQICFLQEKSLKNQSRDKEPITDLRELIFKKRTFWNNFQYPGTVVTQPQFLGYLWCIPTSNRFYAPTATQYLLINSLHSPFPQSLSLLQTPFLKELLLPRSLLLRSYHTE